ncbi:MAG: PQQ-binding-like beta-propeller repeat protein [bacterium]|nr:PQQ-binding-like beta-propeller repeat protein [bacterium]
MEEVRVCRRCGHIDPADSRGRCPSCDLFTELTFLPRPEAEQLVRRRRRSELRRRLLRLFLLLAVIGSATAWVARAFFDRGLDPPRATTRLSASIGPHTWAQFRRTPQNTGFTPDSAPFPHHVKWTYHSTKPLLASPAVVENHVYLTTADGRMLALDRQTGQPVWTYHTGWLSSSTPAVAGNTVIFAIRPGLLTALNRYTGAVRWENNLKQAIIASPVVVNGTVYIGAADQKLYALDAATGQLRWVFTADAWLISAVAYAGDRVIVASQDSRIHAVGSETGSRRFLYDTGLGRQIMASPAIQGDRAYFGSLGGRVWAIDWQATTYPLERGLLFWQTNLFIWGFLSKPPVQKGSIWSKRVGSDVVHTPAIAHDTVYIATTQGMVVALNATTGAKRWQADLDVDISAALTVAGTSVLVGTKAGTVFGLDAHTGKVLWDFKTKGRITGSPIVAGDTMYVVSHDGTLYAVTRSE